MPRPCKRRRICALPENRSFAPVNGNVESCEEKEKIIMTLDEYEAVRLIDLEGLSQEECAGRMEVARTTAQAVYNSARTKLARCLCLLYTSCSFVQTYTGLASSSLLVTLKDSSIRHNPRYMSMISSSDASISLVRSI